MNIPAVTPAKINQYTDKFNCFLDPNVEELWQAAIQRSDILPCIQKDTAFILQLLIQLLQPQRILELGTGVGVSTLIMASVLPEAGHIVTVERSSTFAAEAEQNFKQYGMSERITLYVRDAVELVPELTSQFDLIFQDSGKQTYVPTLDYLVELLNPGGFLLADDTLFPAMELPDRNRNSQRVIDQFNNAVRQHPLLESYILPIGHGLTIARKISEKY
jgi:predicted O-methyltransferase YrrM